MKMKKPTKDVFKGRQTKRWSFSVFQCDWLSGQKCILYKVMASWWVTMLTQKQ